MGGRRNGNHTSINGENKAAQLSKSFHAGKRSGPWDGGGGGGGGPAPQGEGGATAAAATAGGAAAAPPHQKLRRHQTTGLEGLKERQRHQEADQKEREHKKTAATRLLKQWMERTNGDVYEMMLSCKLFTDIFPMGDPLAAAAAGGGGGGPGPPLLTRGDGTSLKKAWHKLAAKLHPDRQRNNDTATQVLAEEVFKALTLAYQKEAQRLGGL